jgi:predicted deacylase
MDRMYYGAAGPTRRFEHRLEWLTVSVLASGYELRIPVLTVEGAAPGPTVGLTAGIHGDEHTGTEIIRRVLTAVDRTQLHGCIRAIPVVNPLAFETRTRHTPLDMQNLNRIFPGSRTGWLTEQLASSLVAGFLPGLDYLIDIHAGGDGGWVDYVYWVGDRAASLAAGAEVIYGGPHPVGTLHDAARDRGVRDIAVFEFGGNDCSDNPLVEKGVRCATNLLRHWGLLDGTPVVPPVQYVLRRKTVIRPTSGGLLYQTEAAKIGARVDGGTVLAYVVSPYTFEILEALKAPYERNLIFHVRYHDGRVNPGEYAFQCGDLTTAEIVEN